MLVNAEVMNETIETSRLKRFRVRGELTKTPKHAAGLTNSTRLGQPGGVRSDIDRIPSVEAGPKYSVSTQTVQTKLSFPAVPGGKDSE